MLETSKNVVWQSADGRVTSDHCRVTVQRLFSQIFPNCLKRPKNVVWQSADGRVTSTTVAWPFSDFFQNFPKSLETSKKRCLTVGRRSRDLRPLSRDRSATFFKKISNCLKRRNIAVWQSADSRVTSDHCHVTVQRLFSKKFLITWNVEKSLFDSRPMVAWPPTTLAWPFRDFFFKILPNCLKRLKNFVWQSADGRVTFDHCRMTVQRLFSKLFPIAWNVKETLFDSRLMVAWPPTTVAWPFNEFFQNSPKSLETSKKRCLTVGRQSRDLRPLSRYIWRSVQWLFSKTFLVAWNIQKRCLTVGRRLRDLRPLSRDRSGTFFKKVPNCLKRPKNVVWQSDDGRVTVRLLCFHVRFVRLPIR